MENLFFPNEPMGFTWVGLILSILIAVLVILTNGYIKVRRSKKLKEESHSRKK